jgi:hypothetical protein
VPIKKIDEFRIFEEHRTPGDLNAAQEFLDVEDVEEMSPLVDKVEVLPPQHDGFTRKG